MGITNKDGIWLIDKAGISISEERFLGIDISKLPKNAGSYTCIPVAPSLWKTKAEWDEEKAKDIERLMKPLAVDGKPITMEDIQKILFADVESQIQQYYRSAVTVYERKEEKNILHLSLKQIWYDLIESGEKLEEYRLINDYWVKRLVQKVYLPIDAVPMVFIKPYTHVELSLGYPKADDWSRRMLFEIESISIGRGNMNWGAPADEDVFKIKLGKRIVK